MAPHSCDAPAAPTLDSMAFMRVARPVNGIIRAARALGGLNRCAGGIRNGQRSAHGPVLAAVLPMEPQPSRLRSQWFEGWFVRLVDHDAATSIAVIFGSLRRRRRRGASLADGPFDEHLIVAGHTSLNGSQGMERVLLDGPSVRLSGAPAIEDGAAGARGPRLSWWSDAHGGMRVHGEALTLDLLLPRGLRIVANVSGPRVPWDARRPDDAGPEGWLSRTGLLPCHYFVHSFGSRASYAVWDDGRPRGPPRLSGTALTHIERNWGDAFPTGWVWAQAAGANGSAFVVLTGGRFVIGPLTTDSYVIGLRVPSRGRGGDGLAGGLSWDFRTTDLDRVADARRPCDGELAINASSRDGRRHLELRLAAPPPSFGERLPVPTSDRGFSDEPGCRESHVATLSLRAWERRRRRGELVEVPRHAAAVPLAVLEFGGGFQCHR